MELLLLQLRLAQPLARLLRPPPVLGPRLAGVHELLEPLARRAELAERHVRLAEEVRDVRLGEALLVEPEQVVARLARVRDGLARVDLCLVLEPLRLVL